MSITNTSSLSTVTRARVLSGSDVHALSVGALGLDADALDLESPEALAALVRRAASFSTPCSPRALTDAVLRCLVRLTSEALGAREELRESIRETIESLTSYGDLLELPADDPNESATARTLYLAPPTYVHVDEVLFLLGGALDGADALPSDLRAAVEFRSHTRRIRFGDEADVASRLKAIGWVELRRKFWLQSPTAVTPGELIASANAALATKPTGGEVRGLIILNTQTPTAFYPDRWAEPARKSGKFVARREQRYGADLWSYVELVNGDITHLVDLPLDARSDVRPCDAAWHLQMALDMLAGRPQLYRERLSPPAGQVLVDFFSPIPRWARRSWDVLGEEIPRNRSLFAYNFPASVFADVKATLHSVLWLAERPSS